jgi:streptogramin lyase
LTTVRRSLFAATLAVLAASVSGIASAQVITDFPPLVSLPRVTGIAAGSDGNLWFTEGLGNPQGLNRIGRITTAGIFTEFTVPTSPSGPNLIAAGPEGNLWFTENLANQIGRITPAGSITEFPIPTADSLPQGIAAGPDGNLWFTESHGNNIGRITTAGVVTEFPVPTANAGVGGIAAGPDGDLWFTEGADKIGRITTAGMITEFPTTSGSGPTSIAGGPDGNLWFTETSPSRIGRITTAGAVTGEFPTTTPGSSPLGIAAGPDGNLWFTEYEVGQIGRMNTAGVPIGEFVTPLVSLTGPKAICAGPDGNLWFAEFGQEASPFGGIGRITTGGLEAQVMLVDATTVAGTTSNANGVLETGETVQVAPAWLNSDVASAHTFTGTASELIGPGGLTYTIDDDSADFGTVDAATPQDCATASGDCYLMTVSGARPGQHWDASFTESLSAGSIVHSWTLHVGESFPDVPTSQQFYAYIENLFHNGITGGCAGGTFCPDAPVTRAQMAVFLLKSLGGKNYTPPPCSETLFADEPCPGGPFVDWVNQLAQLGITSGCGGLPAKYCPYDPVRRDQMAAFLLKALHGPNYGGPACTGIFVDVPCPSQFARWIEELSREGITAGCGGGNYCPASSNTRGQMAVFLVKTFGLLLYGP